MRIGDQLAMSMSLPCRLRGGLPAKTMAAMATRPCPDYSTKPWPRHGNRSYGTG